MSELKAAFDDPDAYKTAQRKIQALRQGTKDCSTYNAEFVPLATILRIDDRTKISYFQQGLNDALQDSLAQQLLLPEEFNEYVQACIKIDNQLRARKEQKSAHRSHDGRFTPHQNTTATGTQPGPMDLSAAGRGPQRTQGQKRTPLTEAQKKHHRDNNLCLYCGSAGHWASNCPLKKSNPTNPKPTNRAATASTLPENTEGGVTLYESKN